VETLERAPIVEVGCMSVTDSYRVLTLHRCTRTVTVCMLYA